ncbi:MAG: hypothetical protein ABJC05_09390 [Pyrinomonadaceae bacterium]
MRICASPPGYRRQRIRENARAIVINKGFAVHVTEVLIVFINELALWAQFHRFLLKVVVWGSEAVGCKRSEKPCLQDYTDQAEQTITDFSFHGKMRMTKKDMSPVTAKK